jgi:cardiolipin synthase
MNVDNRSFEHNDEVNVVVRDPAVARRLTDDFEADLRHSVEITLEAFRRRPIHEKLVSPIAWILERQQ